MKQFFIEQWRQIRGNFKYDLIRSFVLAAVLASGSGIVNKIRHIPLDWVGLISVFLIGVAVLLLIDRRQTALMGPLPARVDLEEKPVADADPLRVELYEPTFIAPKVGDFAFKLLVGKYVAEGKRPEEATTDCDLLIELYVVNKNTKKIYIRDFAAWMEIAGVWQRLKLDENFDVDDLWSGQVEYGLEPKDGSTSPEEPSSLPDLLKYRKADLQPGEPIEGWLKFTAIGINPQIKYPLRVAVIDSLGTEHHIDKSVPKSRAIAYRRVTRTSGKGF